MCARTKSRCADVHNACLCLNSTSHTWEYSSHAFPTFWVLPKKLIPTYSKSGFPTKILRSFIFSIRTFLQVYCHGMCHRKQINNSLRTSVTATRSPFVICAFLVAAQCRGQEIYMSGHLSKVQQKTYDVSWFYLLLETS